MLTTAAADLHPFALISRHFSLIFIDSFFLSSLSSLAFLSFCLSSLASLASLSSISASVAAPAPLPGASPLAARVS